VSRYLLDINIISNVTKPLPSESLVAWLAEQADEDLFISALTVAEIRRGILEKPAGKKRKELGRGLSGPKGPRALFTACPLPRVVRLGYSTRGRSDLAFCRARAVAHHLGARTS